MTAKPSDTPEGELRVIVCGLDNQDDSDRPYFIGYSDLVDSYRHAWAETTRTGRRKMRRSRSANHPADPRCPECAGVEQ